MQRKASTYFNVTRATPSAAVKVGDTLPAPGGIYTVTDTAIGVGGTILLRGSVGDQALGWTAYPEDAPLDVVTLH